MVKILEHRKEITAGGAILFTILFILSQQPGEPVYGVSFEFPNNATCWENKCWIEGYISHNMSGNLNINSENLFGEFPRHVDSKPVRYIKKRLVEEIVLCEGEWEINGKSARCKDNKGKEIFRETFNNLKKQEGKNLIIENERDFWLPVGTDYILEPNTRYPFRFDFIVPEHSRGKFNITLEAMGAKFILDPWWDASLTIAPPSYLTDTYDSTSGLNSNQCRAMNFTKFGTETVTDIALMVAADQGTPTGSVNVSIYSNDEATDSPNTQLAYHQFTAGEAQCASTWCNSTGTLDTPVELTDGTVYWIVWRPAVNDAANYYKLPRNNPGTFDNHSSMYGADCTGWLVDTPDILFATFVAEETEPKPSCINISINKSPIQTFNLTSYKITATLDNCTGRRLEGGTVTFKINNSVTIGTNTTDSNGVAVFSVHTANISQSIFNGTQLFNVSIEANSSHFATYNSTSEKIDFFQNKSLGNYYTATNTLRSGDVNNDGETDICGANNDGTNARDYFFCYLNDGNGTSWTNYTVEDRSGGSSYPHDFEFVDMNKDGYLDIVAADYGDGQILYYENDKTGTGWSKTIVNSSATKGHHATAYDYDDDGDIDIGGANIDVGAVLYENQGDNATFSGSVIDSSQDARHAWFADMDGDSDYDFVVVFGKPTGGAAKCSWYENGDSWSQHQILSGGDPRWCYPYDIDGNGTMDIIATSIEASSDLDIYWNGGAGPAGTPTTVSTTPANFYYALPGDIDNDGDYDIVATTYYSDKVFLYENLGDNTTYKESVISHTESNRGVVFDSLNDDVYDDIAFSEEEGDKEIFVFLSRGEYAGENLVLSWDWADANTTIGVDYTKPCITGDSDMNCTLNFNGTESTNATGQTSLCFTKTGLADGNYSTVQATCWNQTSNVSSTSLWVDVSATTNPVLTINTPVNQSVYLTYKVNLTADRNVNCTLTVNSTRYVNTTTADEIVWTLTESEGNYTSIYATCNDSNDLRSNSSIFWLRFTDYPRLAWNWTNSNSTIAQTEDKLCVNSSELINCTLNFDGTITQNTSTDRNICWEKTGLSNGNYTTIYATCDDSFGISANTSTGWLVIDVVDPVLAWNWNEKNTTSDDARINVTVKSNEGLADCSLNISGTNYLMTQNTSEIYYYEFIISSDANYTMRASCNDTEDNLGITSLAWYEYDTTAPVVTWGSWNGKNETTDTNATTITWTTDEVATNCTLNFNGTIYSIGTSGTSFSKSLSNEKDGNYSTIVARCADATNNTGQSSTAWWNVSIGEVQDIEWSWSDRNSNIDDGDSDPAVVVSSTYSYCILNFNGTDYTMSNTSTTFYYNLTGLFPGNYTNIWVNCTNGTNLINSTIAWLNVTREGLDINVAVPWNLSRVRFNASSYTQNNLTPVNQSEATGVYNVTNSGSVALVAIWVRTNISAHSCFTNYIDNSSTLSTSTRTEVDENWVRVPFTLGTGDSAYMWRSLYLSFCPGRFDQWSFEFRGG